VLVPKVATTLKGYSRTQLVADVTAGLIVGIVALPLAIAFAVASGVSPERGLFTAIIAGFLISALGGSRVQIGGPTGAFVVIVYGIVQTHGVEGLVIATMMAGVLLLVMGLARFGGAIKFIPHSVVTGFTSGIALIILSSQVKDFLGLRMGEVPADFFAKWAAFARSVATVNPQAVVVAMLALGILLVWPRITRRVPAPFVALLVTTVLARVFEMDVETLGTRFGEISSAFPTPSIPRASLATVRELLGPAFTIALLAGIESLLSAVVADGMIGGRHRSNMELVAQGTANLVAPLFGGIPATGAIARTATNIKSGGRTPVAGMVHSLTLLLITMFFGRWAAYIPFATLAAILLVVAYHMSEWRNFLAEFTAPRGDLVVLLVTFGLTVAADLTVAIQVGMVLSAFLFMKRMADVTNVRAVTDEFREELEDEADTAAVERRTLPKDVEVYEINGPFFFGAAETFKAALATVAPPPKVLILRLRHVPAIDSTGLHALGELVRRARSEGTRVILSDVHAQPLVALGRSHLLGEIGEENLTGGIDDALSVARKHLIPPPAPAPQRRRSPTPQI
jgi:sulfate permease, SulP family